jgi:hypothetical protein
MGDRQSPLLPVVCLPGLMRTAEDFTVTRPVTSAAPRKRAGGVRRNGPESDADQRHLWLELISYSTNQRRC